MDAESLCTDCRFVLLYNGSLVINRVDAQDAAVYKCVGYTNSGPVQTFAVQLILACKFVCIYVTSQWSSGNMPDCRERDLRIESYRGHWCLFITTAIVIHCLGNMLRSALGSMLPRHNVSQWRS